MEGRQTNAAKQVTSPKCLHLYDMGRDPGESPDWYLGMAVLERYPTGRVR